MNPHLRAMLRFWWLLVLGVLAGVLTLTLMVYRVDLKFPPKEVPKLTERAETSYTATLSLLVDSPESPYLRTQSHEVLDKTSLPPTRARTGGGGKDSSSTETSKKPESSTPTPLETRIVPDRASLVRAANFYPLLIESDTVTAMREKITGPIPGIVRARALGARTSGGRTRPSSIPVIQISSLASTPRHAIRLVEGTAQAFRKYLTAEQRRTKVAPEQKILLKELTSAKHAIPSGGASYSLPVLAGGAVFFAFVGLALMLDRTFPRRRREESAPAAGLEGQPAASEPAHLAVVENDPDALGQAVAQIAREVGALRARATQHTP